MSSFKRPREEQSSSSSSKKSSQAPQPTVPSGPLRSSTLPSSGADSDDEDQPSIVGQQVIILLDQARLETVKTRKGDFELLNCDDHKDVMKRANKDPSDYRPDIAHQELLALLDSPLNKAGKLKVYMRTLKNVLIEINPQIRIPRTYKRFSGLMVQLLHKLKIKAANSNTTLLKVVKNPFSNHLPPGVRVYGIECGGSLFSPMSLASYIFDAKRPPAVGSVGGGGGSGNRSSDSVCFVIGAMATGSITAEEHPYVEEMISISDYPLSGATAINRLLGAIEHHWGIH